MDSSAILIGLGGGEDDNGKRCPPFIEELPDETDKRIDALEEELREWKNWKESVMTRVQNLEGRLIDKDADIVMLARRIVTLQQHHADAEETRRLEADDGSCVATGVFMGLTAVMLPVLCLLRSYKI